MTESVKQEHFGTGDNVAGNKIIQSMQAGDFVKVAHDLYLLINIGAFQEAKNTLVLIGQLPNKSLELIQLIEVISIYLEAKEKKCIENTNEIKAVISLNPEKFNDLYKAILIEVTFISSSSDALAIYNLYEQENSIYLKSLKYRLFSEKEELKQIFETELLILDDLKLFSLAKGLNRVEVKSDALIALEKIYIKHEKLEILKIDLKFDILLVLLDRPLMYLEKSIVEDFITIAFEFIELIKNKKELSQNELKILTNLVITSDFSICNIMDVAVNFIDDIRPIKNEVADALKIYAENKVELSQDLLNKINDLKPLTLEEAILILNSIKSNKIYSKKVNKWISECGEVEDQNIFNKDLLTLILKSFVFKDKDNIVEFEKDFSNFLENKEKKFRNIQPFFIITFCENLFLFKKQQYLNTYRLLEKFVSKNSFQSKIYLYYLYSMMNLEKYDTLKSHIENIGSDHITPDFLILRARYYSVLNDYLNSKKDYIEILGLYEESLNIWSEYLLLSLKYEDIHQTKKVLDDIPEKILTPRAKDIFRFIYLVYTEIDSVYAEKLITKLFLMEPNFVAPYLCNMHLTLIASKKELVSDLTYENVYEGVIYEVESERKQKLIVSDEFSNFSHFINIDCDLGTSLLEMKEGEERLIGYQKIKLIEKQSSFITIFQIAITITEDNRHNSSHFTFVSLKVRDDFIVEDMKEILQRFTRDDHTENLIANPDLTMYIKGSLFKNHEEFETVLKILQNSKANFCLSNGVGNTVASEALIVDIYSFIYLCFNNNYKALIQSGIKIFLTQETFDVIFEWIKKVTDDSFLSVGLVEESLIKTDANTVAAYYASFIHQLNELLDYAKIISPNIIDLPDFANEIRDILSPSVFSTLRLSIANDIPWLCLDSALRTIFVKQDDVKVVKLHDFLSLLGNYLEFEERKTSIIQWSNFGLFTVYSYTDLIELARSTDSNDWILLKNLLNETPLSFNNYEQALGVLSTILKLTLVKYLKKNNLIEIKSLENLIFACLNKCMQSIYGVFREDCLAKVIVEVMESIRFSEYLFKIFCNFLGQYAVGNFLNITYINEKIEILINE